MVFSSTIVALPIARAPTCARRTRPRVGERELEALALAAEQRDGSTGVSSKKSSTWLVPRRPIIGWSRPIGEAGQALVDQEHRNAPGAGGRVGHGGDEEEVGDRAVADEMLVAGKPPAGAVAHARAS